MSPPMLAKPTKRGHFPQDGIIVPGIAEPSLKSEQALVIFPATLILINIIFIIIAHFYHYFNDKFD